jgi:signal transduction histidine kinase
MRPRHVRAPWLLDAVVVGAGLVAVVLLVASTRLTLSTLDRNGAWNQTLGSLRLNAGLSYAWLEAAIADDQPTRAERHFVADIDSARERCRYLLDGRSNPVEGVAARATVAGLCAQLASFRVTSLRRLHERTAAPDGAYAAAFARSLRAADQAEQAIAVKIAERRARLIRIDTGLVVLVLLMFAGMAIVVSRRANHLAAQNQRLRRLDRLKDDFIAAVSHELRTPLTATIGFLQTLERADLQLAQAERNELIRIARLQAERLARLVNDLLFVSEVETGKLCLSYTSVDVAALSAECVHAAEALAQEKGVVLKLDTEPVPPLHGDRARLAQLLDNLLSNALKFTPRNGQIEVRARAKDGRAQLEVSDTGIGIPSSEQAQLFDRFYRTSAAGKHAIPGTGLGLAIVKAIAVAHNGAVSVESQEARGTTVRIDLPLVPG